MLSEKEIKRIALVVEVEMDGKVAADDCLKIATVMAVTQETARIAALIWKAFELIGKKQSPTVAELMVKTSAAFDDRLCSLASIAGATLLDHIPMAYVTPATAIAFKQIHNSKEEESNNG